MCVVWKGYLRFRAIHRVATYGPVSILSVNVSECSVMSPCAPAAPGQKSALRVWWCLIALAIGALSAPSFIASLQPPDHVILDFFKEWASTQNLLRDQPIYRSQRLTIQEYLRQDLNSDAEFFDEYNTHPPTAVLIALPCAPFEYRNAQLVWNLLSLAALAVSGWLIVRQMSVRPSAMAVLPVIALLLICNPFRETINQGQPNLILLLLIVGSWVADRRCKPAWAGFCLALATAIKLYPGFLFVYFALRFALRRDWRVLMWGTVSFIGITALTAGVLGVDAYVDYFTKVLPNLESVTNNWGNSSLLAFWERLFGTSHEAIITVTPWRAGVLVGTVASIAVLLACLAWSICRANSRRDRDLAFGMSILAMLLISPTTWIHYLILAAIPVVLLWNLPLRWKVAHGVCVVAVIALWMSPRIAWTALIPPEPVVAEQGDPPQKHKRQPLAGRVSRPVHSLTALSYQTYALLALFALSAVHIRKQEAPKLGIFEERGS